MAIWVSDLSDLSGLQKARVRGLRRLLEKQNIGVAHHQMEVFLIEPGTDRYPGRLCLFQTCPFEGKDECRVPGCGASRFLQQHESFMLAPGALAPGKIRVLFDRSAPSGTG